MNHNVYTLDLEKAPSEQEWEERSTDEIVAAPWFTSTRGFIQIDDHAYLACDDSDLNGVYRFNPVTYRSSSCRNRLWARTSTPGTVARSG